MIRRRFKPLVYLLAAAQLLLAAPMVQAAPAASTGPAAAHCSDAMPASSDTAAQPGDTGSEDEAPCPCCPDMTTVAGCASVCVAAQGATNTLQIPDLRATDIHAVGALFLSAPAAADPPLNPPPIA